MLDQHLQQAEFTGGEQGGRAFARQFARGEVDGHLAEMHFLVRGGGRAGRRRRGAAAQHGVDACHQFARVERFGQIVVGAEFEADDAVDVVAFRGEHEDGDRILGTATATQAAADRQAVFARQHQVENDQVVEFAFEGAIHAAAVRDGFDGEALIGKIALQLAAQAHVIIDDEDFGFAGLGIHGRKDTAVSGRGIARCCRHGNSQRIVTNPAAACPGPRPRMRA